METNPVNLNSPELVRDLRRRWTTSKGQILSNQLVKALHAKDQNWPQMLAEFSLKGVPYYLEDLRGLELSQVDLSETDLSFVDLSYSLLTNCNLNSATLQGSVLFSADLSSSSFVEADLLQVKCDLARFDNADLTGAVMIAGSYNSASFKNAVLYTALLDQSDLRLADMTGANLQNASWRKTAVEGMVVDRETISRPNEFALGNFVEIQTLALIHHYEIIILMHPDQSDQIPFMLETYKSLISAGGGTVRRIENWGLRQIAYRVNNLSKAHYLCINVEIDRNTLLELEHVFKYNEAVLRYLIVVRKKTETGLYPMKELNERERQRLTEIEFSTSKNAIEKKIFYGGVD